MADPRPEPVRGEGVLTGRVVCGKTARVYLEAGRMRLICTLEPHGKNIDHYDSAFFIAWRDIEQASAHP